MSIQEFTLSLHSVQTSFTIIIHNKTMRR